MKQICKEPQTSNLNLSIIPVKADKLPSGTWKQFQSSISPVSNWHNHYRNNGYVGVICGAVSDNLECIDVDIKNDPKRTINDELTKLLSPIINTSLIQKTPSGGLHIIYRCPEATIEGNQKLALSETGEVIIETRGEGGYFATHLTAYQLKQGVFDLTNCDVEIPVISKEQRELILDSARSLTRYFPIKKDKENFSYKEPAINQFNEEYDIIPVLERNGFESVDNDSEKIHLLRKGSSATHSGYYFKDTKVFFCFSPSTLFKVQKPYNNFQILQLLEGKNDYRSTLKLLNDLGYATNEKSDKITDEGIAEFIHSAGIRFNRFTQDIEIRGSEILDQKTYNTTYLEMKKHFDKEVAKNRFDDVINSNYIQEHHPITNFIEENSSGSTSSTLKQWFDCIELNNPNIDRDIALTYITKWYVGLIAQALDGKYPNEFFLTFLSTVQGIGKTSLLRNHLIPFALQKYVSEHPLDFTEDFKVLMGQTLLIVDDEMDGKTWNQMNQFKSVLSTNSMTLRRKYDRRISQIQRRASFAGSGNNLQVIKEYQNRRIIPIEVKSIDFKALEQVNLNSMFIEAYNLFKEGYQYSFQKSDFKNLKHLYEDYVQKSDLDIILDEYLEIPDNEEDVFYITNLEIVKSINANFDQFGKKLTNVILGKMMVERGYSSVQKTKRRTTCYKISSESKILQIIDLNSDSWNLNPNPISDYLSNNNNDLNNN